MSSEDGHKRTSREAPVEAGEETAEGEEGTGTLHVDEEKEEGDHDNSTDNDAVIREHSQSGIADFEGQDGMPKTDEEMKNRELQRLREAATAQIRAWDNILVDAKIAGGNFLAANDKEEENQHNCKDRSYRDDLGPTSTKNSKEAETEEESTNNPMSKSALKQVGIGITVQVPEVQGDVHNQVGQETALEDHPEMPARFSAPRAAPRPPAPPLRQPTGERHQRPPWRSLPGAFLVQGMFAPSSSSGTEPNSQENQQRVDQVDAVAPPENLVEARPVSGLTEAAPVDLDELEQQQQRHQQRQQSKKHMKCMLAAGLCIPLAVILVVVLVLGLDASTEDDHNSNISDGDEAASNATSASIKLLLDILPNYTMVAIQDSPFSPQSQAYQWMLEDPYLQNYTQHRLRQRFALVTFFFATNGTAWSSDVNAHQNWLSYDHDECDWDATVSPAAATAVGLFVHKPYQWFSPCDDQSNIIQNLFLFGKDLQGTLPPELFWGLSSLKRLDFSVHPSLTSTLPSEIGMLSDLEEMYVTGVPQLTGTIPSEFFLLSSLRMLFLQQSALTGSFPSELGTMQSLDSLLVGISLFSGSLPTELGMLSGLNHLSLVHCDLITSPLPSELGELSNVFFMNMRSNSFTGTLPTELAKMSLLKELWLNDNLLTGTVPSQPPGLIGLHLDQNNLEGSLPSQLGQLTALEQLRLSQNQFTGKLPSEIGLLSKLYNLELRDNQLTGTLPSELCLLNGNLTSMASGVEMNQYQPYSDLDLANNLLTGDLPTDLGKLTVWEKLDLSNNLFGGAIPSQLGRLTLMEELKLSQNDLVGFIPSELGLLHKTLVSLDLSQNQLTGTLPTELCLMKNTTSLLNISWNILSGIVPPLLCQLNESIFDFDCSDTLCGCDDCICGR